MDTIPYRAVIVSHPDENDTTYSASLSTDFLLRFTLKGRLEDEMDYVPTVFDNYQQQYTTKTGEKIFLSLWDTAGQHTYARLRIGSYSGANVFVCIFPLNRRRDFDCMINTHIAEMRLHGSTANIVLVGCFPEKRDKIIHEKGVDFCNFSSSNSSLFPDAVLAEEGLAAAKKLQEESIRSGNPIHVTYIEYSPQTFVGFDSVVDSMIELAMKGRRNEGTKKKKSLIGKIIPSVKFPKISFGSKKEEKKIAQASLNPEILALLDRLTSPIDEELLHQQEKWIADDKVLGVFASAFSILRLLHNIHSNTLTTRSIVAEIIIPATVGAQCSYFHYLLGRRDSSGQVLVGLASVFLSHAWDYPFSLLEQLAADFSTIFYFRQKEEFPYYWCDLFIKNQHMQAPVDNEFITAITNCKCTLGVLNEARDPLPLSRIWCLFEYYHTMRLNVQLQLFFPLSEVSSKDFKFMSSYDVDVRSANAKVLSDKDRILNDVEASLGIDVFNARLKQLMNDCCPSVIQEASYRQKLIDRFG